MFKRFNVAFIIFSLFVSNVFTMDNSKNKSKTIPVKLTAEQADYLFSKLTKEEQGLMYVDNGQIFIKDSRKPRRCLLRPGMNRVHLCGI